MRSFVELEKFDKKYNNIRPVGWYLGNLSEGTWATYKDVEIGRTKPFTMLTLRYAAQEDRIGAEIDVYLNAKITPNEGDAIEGQKIATFVIQDTGGFQIPKEVSAPIQVPKAGLYDVTVYARRANAKAGNALANLDKLIFSDGK